MSTAGVLAPVAIGLAAALMLAGALGLMAVAVDPESGAVDHLELTRRIAGRYAGQLFVVGLFLFWLIRAPRPDPDRRAGVLRSIGIGVIAMTLMWPLLQTVSIMARWVRSLFDAEPTGPIAHEMLSTMVEAPRDGWIACLALMLIVGPPLVEEIMYRGLIQRALFENLAHRWAAIVLTSGVFVLMHVGAVELHALPTLFVFSMGLGWAYDRTGSLLTPMIMHGLFNLANLVLAFEVL